jgi:hypothetical protein
MGMKGAIPDVAKIRERVQDETRGSGEGAVLVQ